jgi:uncharacterized membrane protein YgcG
MATKDAKKVSSGLKNVLSVIFSLIVWIGIIAGPIVFFLKNSNDIPNMKFIFGKGKNKVPKDVPYFRDIPCNKDLFRAYAIASIYKINKNKMDFLGSILLKWIKNGTARIEKKVKGIFNKETSCVVLTGKKVFENPMEEELYNMLYQASGDGILEPNEMKKYCKKNYSKVIKWYDDVIKSEVEKLGKEGKIYDTPGILARQYYIYDGLYEEALQVGGLKRYLNEYTLISDRAPIEVQLFEEYLMYAQIFGIADKVAKDFKDLYPDMVENLDYDFNDIIVINLFSTSASSSVYSGMSTAGGGGSSFGGGGGGSFGGGFGRRRRTLKCCTF